MSDTFRNCARCRQLWMRFARWTPTPQHMRAVLAHGIPMEHPVKPKRPKPGYEPIYVSDSECWTSGRFIDHFLLTHRFAVTPANRELVRVVMRSYPGPRPIMASDIAVYLLRHFSRQHEPG